MKDYSMKRSGYIIEEIIEKDNMESAFDRVMRGSKKKTRAGRRTMRNREIIISRLTDQIECDMYSIKGYREFSVKEHEKVRTIQSVSYEDRIALHAIMAIVGKHIKKRLIRDTFAAIPGRGMHDGLNRLRKVLRDDPEGTKYCYKADIHKFYQSIKQEFVLYALSRIFKDKRLLNTMARIIHVLDNGLSIGMRPSQDLGNLLLSVFLDHFLKDKYGVKYYSRYCDDIVILGRTKEELAEIAEKVHFHIESIGLEIKNNERIFDVEECGIDYLGYVIRHDYVLLRKRIKKRFAQKIKTIRSKRRRQELIAAFYGYAKHANCNNLFYKLTGTRMRDFSDLNVKWKPEDGKQWWTCEVVRIADITNVPIIVCNFETNVKTEQGNDRYLVLIEIDGVEKKFFTNSKQMKSILDQIKEIPDGLPFRTTIKRRNVGKIIVYEFT
jgi:hypothetical protein